MFPVKEIYLEEILVGLKYSTPAMKRVPGRWTVEGGRWTALEDITKNLVFNIFLTE
jgi:hypothetical protein